MKNKSKGLWIPTEILEMNDLGNTEKLFLAVIYSFDANGKECNASNSWFAKYFNTTPKYASQVINTLSRKNRIGIQLERDRVSREIRKRVCRINRIGIPQKLEGTYKGYNKEDNTIKAENFQLFSDVVSCFDPKYFDQDKWLNCYDKLIRIDKYSEADILNIVKEFRSEGSWYKDNGNFETLLKLRKKNSEGIKYIDVFNSKLQTQLKNGSKNTNTQPATKDELLKDELRKH